MRRPTAAVLALAAVLAAPARASAKGVVAMSVCGANGCQRVERAAVRATVDAYATAPAPRSAEPFFTLRAKARVSSGRVVEVFALDWLPHAGLTRATGERTWTRPSPKLAAALGRAAHGLRPHRPADLGSIAAAPPTARVVEVYAPARDDRRAPLLAAAAATAVLAVLAKRRRG